MGEPVVGITDTRIDVQILRRLRDTDAVPTPDHFIPLLYAAGIANSGGQVAEITGGCSLGSIAMTSWSIN